MDHHIEFVRQGEKKLTAHLSWARRLLIIEGLLIALGVPMLPLSDWEHEFAGTSHLIGYELIWWALVAWIFFQTVILERDQLSSLGFRAVKLVEILAAIGIGIVTLVVVALLYYEVLPRLHLSEAAEMHSLTQTPLWWRAISVVRASVGEEVLFRGYAITRLRTLTRSLPLAATISWLVFTIAHIGSWGWGHLLIAGFGGLMLTLAFLWRGNIWVSIIAHAVIDGAAVLS
jgi:uncharacterized protein